MRTLLLLATLALLALPTGAAETYVDDRWGDCHVSLFATVICIDERVYVVGAFTCVADGATRTCEAPFEATFLLAGRGCYDVSVMAFAFDLPTDAYASWPCYEGLRAKSEARSGTTVVEGVPAEGMSVPLYGVTCTGEIDNGFGYSHACGSHFLGAVAIPAA